MELTDDRGADDRDNHGFMESLFPISSAAESDRSAGDCSTTRRRPKWSVIANRALQMGGGTADRYHLCTRHGGGRSARSLFGALGVGNGQRLGRQRAQKGRRHSVERLHRKYAYSASGARRRSLSTDRAPSPLNGWTAYPLSEYQRRPPRAEQAVAVAAAPQCRWRGVNVVAAVEPPAVQSTVHFGRRSD